MKGSDMPRKKEDDFHSEDEAAPPSEVDLLLPESEDEVHYYEDDLGPEQLGKVFMDPIPEDLDEALRREIALERVVALVEYWMETDERMKLPDLAREVVGLATHYPYTLDPRFIDWCGYTVLHAYRKARFPIADSIHEAYKFANTGTLTKLVDDSVGGLSDGRWQVIRPGEAPPRRGDILILKNPGHIALVHAVEADRVLTHEGNRSGRISDDYWYTDNRGGRLSFYIRILKPGKGIPVSPETGFFDPSEGVY